MDDDRTLLERAAGGDDTAFELLVRRHADRLWRLAMTVVRDGQAAEEAVQDGFVKAYFNLGSFRGDAAVSTWLSSIVYRAAIDRVRRKQLNVVPIDQARGRASRRDTDVELGEVLRGALQRLPDQDREAFALVHVLGYSREEAAEICGVPASTLRSRASRAQGRLAEMLTDAGVAAGEGN